MFDPTVFDNLKVVLEGCVYDYDLEEKIAVTGRSDIVDLATLTRTFSVRFTRRHPDVSQVSATSPSLPWGYREDADPAFRNMHEHGAEAEIVLHAELRDLAGELLEGSRTHTAYGCRLWTVFRMVTAHDQLCGDIANLLTSLWGEQVRVMPTVSHGCDPRSKFLLTYVLDFGRKIGETQIGDFDRLTDHAWRSLVRIDERLASIH
jgi:hypothetical protein